MFWFSKTLFVERGIFIWIYFIVNLFGLDSAHPELFETWNIYGIKIQFIMCRVRVFEQIFATGYTLQMF